MSTKKCIILVGPPGVGKSTWVQLNYYDKPCAIVSSDAILEELAQADGVIYNEAFNKYAKVVTPMMWEEMDKRVEEGWETIIVDRTNMSRKARKMFFERLKGKGYKFETVVFPLPGMEEWQRRLDSRPGKSIPKHVLDLMVRSFEMPTVAEGFSKIILVVLP